LWRSGKTLCFYRHSWHGNKAYPWEDYTKAKEVMLERSHIPEAPWWVVQAVDKKRARLNCIDHLLKQIPYADTPKAQVVLPLREHHEHYSRQAVPASMLVPEVY
jgi:hypothetical protein